MMDNPLFKVILVAALSNVGAMLGMFIGVYLIWHWLGLELSADMIWDMIKNGYSLILNYF